MLQPKQVNDNSLPQDKFIDIWWYCDNWGNGNWTKGRRKDGLMGDINACELFGYSFAVFIFVLAIIEGYTKARLTINQFNKIGDYFKRQYSIELVRRPLNPKYWFMQFDIVRKDGDDYYPIDEELKQRLIK